MKSKITLAVGIAAVMKRLDHVNAMIKHMENGADDRLLGIEKFVDINRRGLWWNYKRMFDGMPSNCTHYLTMPDDVWFPEDYLIGVCNAIEVCPDKPISFYINKGANHVADKAIEQGHTWYIAPKHTWAHGFLLPRRLMLKFLRWEHHYINIACPHDDVRACLWAEFTNHPIWHTVSGLVQHTGAAHSTIGQSNRTRISDHYIGDNAKCSEIEWGDLPEKPVRNMQKVVNSRKYLLRGLK